MERELYTQFYELEERHWWFVARQRIVEDIVQRRLQLTEGSRVLDVGCGTGAILQSFSRRYEAYGTDTSELAIEFCRKRGLTNVYQCTLENFPHRHLPFDLILALDVIEHIDDDFAVVHDACKLLKPEGVLLVTVPAFQFLWSRHDEANHHKRRYVKSQLKAVLTRNGLTVEKISYYNTILFPVALVSRLADRVFRFGGPELTMPPRALNALLASTFASERMLLRSVSLPFGLSLVAVGRKPA